MSNRAGFHSGEVYGQTAKIGGKFISNEIWIPASELNMVSGSITSGVQNNYFSWGYDAASNDGAVGTTIYVPKNIPRNVKANVKPHWTFEVGDAGSVLSGIGQVVMDMDYRGAAALVSGTTQVTGINYILSGSYTNVTTTDTVSDPAYNLSGVIHVSELEIPKGDVNPGEIVSFFIYRDSAESADTLPVKTRLIGVAVEFVEA